MRCRHLSTLLLVCPIVLTGCQTHAIQSDAVRSLIDIEGQKITTAQTNMNAAAAGTASWIENEKSAVSSLNKAMELVNDMEATHSLIFSSNQNVDTKIGADAQAVAYLIGKIYLSDNGLSQTVLDQFDRDYATLALISNQLKASWQSIESLSKAGNGLLETVRLGRGGCGVSKGSFESDSRARRRNLTI